MSLGVSHKLAFALAVAVGCRPWAPPSVETLDARAPAASTDAGGDAARDARGDSPPSPADAQPTDGASLARDVARRARDARETFSEGAAVHVVGGTFVLVETGPPGALFAQAVALLERALPRLYDGRFRAHPDEAVTVLFFPTPAAYGAYAHEHYPDAGATLGVYRRAPREIAVDLSGGAAYLPTLTHEVVHVLVEADFPRAAHWMNEGLATLFEAPVFGDDGAIHGAPNLRTEVLREALASPSARRRVRLEALFRTSRRSFEGEDRELHYAMARSVCAWLDEQGKLWPFYRAWRDGDRGHGVGPGGRGGPRDETGERTFAAVMGATPEELSARWTSWARGGAASPP